MISVVAAVQYGSNCSVVFCTGLQCRTVHCTAGCTVHCTEGCAVHFSPVLHTALQAITIQCTAYHYCASKYKLVLCSALHASSIQCTSNQYYAVFSGQYCDVQYSALLALTVACSVVYNWPIHWPVVRHGKRQLFYMSND